jgi:hypothetical protein
MGKFVEKSRRNRDYYEEEYYEKDQKDSKRKKDQRKMKYFDEYESLYGSRKQGKSQKFRTY